MPTYYSTAAQVTDGLPTGWAALLLAGAVDVARANAKNRVDSSLPDYWPFPDVAATPATPLLAQRAAILYAQAELFRDLQLVQALGEDGTPAQLEKDAEAILGPINAGEKIIPRETITDEAIAFGSIPIYPQEHVLTASPKTVIADSVRISGYLYETDFRVRWRRDARSWMLERINGAIVNGAKVSYEFTYIRRVEVEEPGVETVYVSRV